MTAEWLLVPLVAPAAWWGTRLMRRYALRRGVLDVPGGRSSHALPVPRGGGVAIAVCFYLGLLGAAPFAGISSPLLWALAGGVAVAAIGFLDDHGGVAAPWRLALHAAAAAWAVSWLGRIDPGGDAGLLAAAWFWPVTTVIGLVWLVNLYNFMDGIDGIAAAEGMFVVWAAALLAGPGDLAGFIILGAACLGFLALNWPPASIFMGDAGSGFLGFAIGVLAAGSIEAGQLSLTAWLILTGVFWVDATVTLVRRAMRRERVAQAHRTHAYQHWARRCGSHRPVVLGVIAIDLLWLLPWAWWVEHAPAKALWAPVVALTPVFLLAWWSGAGLPERKSRNPAQDSL